MKTLKKSFAYLISGMLLLLPFSGKTCSYTEYGEDLRISMFRIMTQQMQAYFPFVYTAELFNSNSIVSENDRKRNINEWVKQFENPVRAEDIDVILYKTDPELFYLHAERKTLKKFFEGNTFIEELLKPENKDFYNYLMVSKAIEYKEAQYIDPWTKPDSEQKALSGNLKTSIMKQIRKYSKQTKSAFLKQRYAFQHIRMLFQNNNFEGCVRLYNETFTIYDTSTIVAPWALHYSAISKAILGDSISANYEMSLAFAQCDDKKFRMYTQFYRSPSAIEKTLNLAQNNQERATILGISILNNPGRTLPTLQQMVTLDSKNTMLSFLVLREVNKLEDWLLTTGLTLNTPSIRAGFSYDVNRDDYLRVNFDSDMKYLNNVISVVQQLHQQAIGEEKQFYMLALVHLFTMAENNSAALAMLNSSNSKMPVDFQRQASIENLILLSSGNSLSNPENRNKAGKIFMSLDSLEQNKQMNSMTMYSLCQRYGQAMFAQNDLMRSILFLNLSDDYKSGRWYYDNNWRDNNEQTDEFDYYTLAYMDQSATPDDIDKLIEFINSNKTESLEKFLALQNLPSINQCKELKGSKLFREGNFREAEKVWQELPSSWWKENGEFHDYLSGNLFKPDDLHRGEILNNKLSNSNSINKAAILHRMIEMQDSAETASSDRYKYKLKLAHAWFNVSYYGNNWILAHYYKSCETHAEKSFFGFAGIPNNILADSSNYIQLGTARKLYREVATVAPDAELRCEAMTMLQYIEYLLFVDEYRYDWENKHVFKPTYMPTQWKEYENTAFFKSMYGFCPLFEEFVSL
jgi:hypothetical protein